jgi:tRNA(Ile)-lysidine synthase
MQPVNGKIVRPLLFASRAEIEAYRFENHLEYREDQSNQSLDYQRNKIRHQLLPLLEEMNPSFRENLSRTMGILQDVFSIYSQEITQMWERVSLNKEGDYHISVSELKTLNPLPTYLFEFLKPFHFNSDVVTDILDSLDGSSGKQFFSPTHRLDVDRGYLIVRKIEKIVDKQYYLDEMSTLIDVPMKLKITHLKHDSHFHLVASPKFAFIDRDKLQFPLLIRRWKTGDYFRPLGMKGLKKLSDFFIDEKFSIAEKERVWILANGEQIVWIIGHRLDDRFKITSGTKNILKIEILN